MPGKSDHPDVLEQARAISEAWKQINAELAFGELTQAALNNDLDQVTPIAAQIVALETQLTALRNQRDALYIGLWDKVKRARNGIKAIYGQVFHGLAGFLARAVAFSGQVISPAR